MNTTQNEKLNATREMETTSLYERRFLRILKEKSITTRTDKTGRKVKVPQGHTFQQGKNGKGIAVPLGSRTEEDNTGQLVAIPPGFSMKMGDDGKGVRVGPGEAVTKEPNGRLKVRRPTPELGGTISQMDLLRKLAPLSRHSKPRH
jgi:hypothetical protein